MSRTQEAGAAARGQTFSYAPETLTLVRDKTHPLYDERAELPPDEGAVLSLMRHGVIKPITVRKNGYEPTGTAIIEVMDGRSTVIAAIEANKRLRKAGKPPLLVPAIIRKADDIEAMEIMIAANEIRHKDDIVTRARKFKRLLERNGGDENAARIAFGATKAHELEKLRTVLDMTQALQEALQKKQVTFDIAKDIARLPRDKQAHALAQAMQAGGGKARGPKARSAASRAAPCKSEKKTKVASARQVLKAIDTVACMPSDEYRRGLLDALEWALGKRQMNWGA